MIVFIISVYHFAPLLRSKEDFPKRREFKIIGAIRKFLVNENEFPSQKKNIFLSVKRPFP